MLSSTGDELCDACAKVDLYSLFTGPRYFPRRSDLQSPRDERTYVATLRGVLSNTACPLCRLIKHNICALGGFDPLEHHGGCDPAKIRCYLLAVRADYEEDTEYQNHDTKEMLATRLEIRLAGSHGCSKEELSSINQIPDGGADIRLLSPDSVVPARPLLNGFRATSFDRGLDLLKWWIETCENHHDDTCQSGALDTPPIKMDLETIQVIDVSDRSLKAFDPRIIKYASLSYVWGEARDEHLRSFHGLQTRRDADGKLLTTLPSRVPGIIEEAMMICQRVSVPYLWVDLYCIHQDDPDTKATEINAMGHIYHFSHITIVAGFVQPDAAHPAPSSDSTGETYQLDPGQRIETIKGRQYITTLPSIGDQIRASAWSQRGWTYQEGQMARRIAFWGHSDISFLCGAGHWRESLHSGRFGHDANPPGVDLHSEGYYLLRANHWLKQSQWSFDDYASIVLAYSQRNLSYESDRLDAVSGCLEILSKSRGVHFLSGMPTIDFHYALLWSLGEYDRFREGFPTWSWAAWFAMNQVHWVHPCEGSSESLTSLNDGTYIYSNSEAKVVELDGLLINKGLEEGHKKNKCAQKLAQLSVSKGEGVLTISSEVARFFISIRASSRPDHDLGPGGFSGVIPGDFDSRDEQHPVKWEPDEEYPKPEDRFCLRNVSGDVYPILFPWQEHTPTIIFGLPITLRGSTLTWLLARGIELIKVVEVELLEGADDLKPFHHVLCLGIDWSNTDPDCARRMGVFCLPKEVWEKAKPEKMSVRFR